MKKILFILLLISISLGQFTNEIAGWYKGAFYVPNGIVYSEGLIVVDEGTLASESLNEVDFATHAKWDVTNDFDDSGGNAAFVWTANQTSTLTQIQANLATAGVGSRWYKFTYTLAVTTAFDGDAVATITTSFGLSAVQLEIVTAGTYTIYFKSAVTLTDFVISLVSGSDTEGTISYDDVTLKEITGGDIYIAGTANVSTIFASGSFTLKTGTGATALIVDSDGKLYMESDGDGAQIILTGKTDATADAILLLSAAGATNVQGLKLWYDRSTAYGYIDNLYNNDAGNIYIRTKTASTPIIALTILGTGYVGLTSGTNINEFSTDGTLAGDSDNAVPTEKAVKAYADAIGAAGSDDQKIDVFAVSGNNVQLSLEDDGEATKTVDISLATAVLANTTKVTMTYPSAGIALTNGSSWSASIVDNSINWNTAYTDRLKWDGGATGLVAGTGRTSLGGTTIGQNIFIKTNPGAITFGRANADNTFDWLSDVNFRVAIGVDIAGTDNSTPVTLNASATTGGMSLSTQEISNRAATNAQTGYMTAVLVGNIETNNTKVSVTTEIKNVVEDATPELGGDLDLTDYELLLDSTPDVNVTASGVKAVFTNGDASSHAVGDLVYIVSDDDVQFADASVVGTMPGFAIALSTIVTTASGEYLLQGFIRNDAWTWTIGGLIYATITGTTGNTLSQTAPTVVGEQVQIVGIATTADIIYFNPNLMLIEI